MKSLLKVRDIWIFWPIVTDCTFISSSVIINSDNAYFNSRLPLLYLSRPNNDPAIKVDLQFLQMQIVAKLQSKDLHFVLQGNYSTWKLWVQFVRKEFFFMTSKSMNVVIKTRILKKTFNVRSLFNMGYFNHKELVCCVLVFISTIGLIAGLVAVAHWLPGHIT